MDYKIVCCYTGADVQALQARSDERLDVKLVSLSLQKLVSLESVRVARESYELLRQMVDQRSWICTNMDLLSLLAGVALELHKVERDLFPRLLVQGAKLEGDVLEALLLLKNSAFALIQLGAAVKEKFQQLDESFDDVISGPVRIVGEYLMDIVDLCSAGLILADFGRFNSIL